MNWLVNKYYCTKMKKKGEKYDDDRNHISIFQTNQNKKKELFII